MPRPKLAHVGRRHITARRRSYARHAWKKASIVGSMTAILQRVGHGIEYDSQRQRLVLVGRATPQAPKKLAPSTNPEDNL